MQRNEINGYIMSLADYSLGAKLAVSESEKSKHRIQEGRKVRPTRTKPKYIEEYNDKVSSIRQDESVKQESLQLEALISPRKPRSKAQPQNSPRKQVRKLFATDESGKIDAPRECAIFGHQDEPSTTGFEHVWGTREQVFEYLRLTVLPPSWSS